LGEVIESAQAKGNKMGEGGAENLTFY